MTRLTLGLGLLLLPVFLWVRYLPMVDLPQHAALVGAWLRLSDPTSLEAEAFTLNWQTPYLTAYALSRGLAPWLGVVTSVKVVVWLCCIGFQLAFSLIVRELRYPAWLGLLGVPSSLGFSFYYGFLSFIAGLPFALLSLWAALVFAREPSLRRGSVLGALLALTLLTHGFAAAIALMVVGPVLLSAQRPVVQRLWPLLIPLGFGGAWLLPGRGVSGIGLSIWEPRLLDLLELPAMLVGISTSDRLAPAFGLGILGLVAATLGRPAESPWRWLPLGLVVLAFCLFPVVYAGFAPTFPRFAAFLVPTLLVAFEPRQAGLVSRGKAPAVALVACWLAVLGLRLHLFDAETAPFAALVERLPAGLSMRPIVFERESRAFPGVPALIHLSAYYAAEKGGLQGYSIAMYATSPVRYTESTTPGMLYGAEWHPEDFSIDEELHLYDSFVVHSSVDRSDELFGEAERNLTLAASAGNWWAYRVHSARTSHQALP